MDSSNLKPTSGSFENCLKIFLPWNSFQLIWFQMIQYSPRNLMTVFTFFLGLIATIQKSWELFQNFSQSKNLRRIDIFLRFFPDLKIEIKNSWNKGFRISLNLKSGQPETPKLLKNVFVNLKIQNQKSKYAY